jgi:hypothetical protein
LITALLLMKAQAPQSVPNAINVASGHGVSGEAIWETLVELSGFEEKVTLAPETEIDFSIGAVDELTRLDLSTGIDLRQALTFALRGDRPR